MLHGYCGKCGYLIPFVDDRIRDVICPECATNHSVAHTPGRDNVLYPISLSGDE